MFQLNLLEHCSRIDGLTALNQGHLYFLPFNNSTSPSESTTKGS